MGKITAAITAIGGYVPEKRLTNADLEKLVDTNDEWILSRTGIKERRILDVPGLATSDMAVQAVNELLKKRGISAEEIDLLIVGTVTATFCWQQTNACPINAISAVLHCKVAGVLLLHGGPFQ
mgnify:CR=1 FL=1